MPVKTIKLPNDARMTCLHQGNTNGCGTACIAMILSYLFGKDVTQHEVDLEIRRMNIFTSPGDLVRFAQKQGLTAAAYNNGDLGELQLHLNAGRPVQALIRSERSLHYVVVTGFEDDSNVGECLICLDPATGNRKMIPRAKFLDSWAYLPGLFNNFYIAYSNQTSPLPPERVSDVFLAIKVLDGLTQALNSLHSLLLPASLKSWIKSILQLPSGLLKAILVSPVALLFITLTKMQRWISESAVVKSPVS